MRLLVTQDKKLNANGGVYDIQIGKNGFVKDENKTEGDGKTPCGKYFIQNIYYRQDRIILPELKITPIAIMRDDGWCDDPGDKNYNKFVKLPYNANFERLWRDDNVYDIIITIDHNTTPSIPGRGSAIFIHISNGKSTEGCIALKKDDLVLLIQDLDNNSYIEILC